MVVFETISKNRWFLDMSQHDKVNLLFGVSSPAKVINIATATFTYQQTDSVVTFMFTSSEYFSFELGNFKG